MSDLPNQQSITPESFRRIREVFESALERLPEERAAFVETACGGDGLLIEEVQRMLTAERQSDRLLDGSQQSGRLSTNICPSCKVDVDGAHRFCPLCGTPVESASGTEGRFRTGALFANRFRIVGLLGRGGMGEVYRAQDLELDQPVALKFLATIRFAERARGRLRNEVRLARQISHPNVCRVYDIGEAQGELYLSMEYVDGEDLAALLRRIGRLPLDKGIEIALKLCAGLAAAHAKGMLHRDLKPANIMIDGSGEVRIMDFGLAALADDIRATQVHEGTPSYMAPEQLAGQKVSVQSDIYALGLVLYEMLTGKLPFVGDTPAELRRLREGSRITPPSTLVPDLGPMVERAILRCLDPDPHMRPASAPAVSALLPGGDPLARALAAGETPSPEMVAAAGSTEPVRPKIAILLVLGITLGLAALWLTAPMVQLLSRLSLQNPPEVLTARAMEIARNLGYTDLPADWASGFRQEEGYFEYMKGKVVGDEQWRKAVSKPPPPLSFWHHQSPEPILPSGGGRWWWDYPAQRVRPDGPLTNAGSVSVGTDMEGRLLRFVAQPRADLSPIPEDRSLVPDWSPLFADAGLDPTRFRPVDPQAKHPGVADLRFAWRGTYEHQDVELRVEAGASRGRIVYFEVVPPWPASDRMDIPPLEASVLTLAFLLSAALLARRNWKAGRADLSGAWRVWLFASVLTGLSWALASDHATSAQAFDGLMLTAIPSAVVFGGFVSLCYLAIESWGRRELPGAMISWSRVLAGRWRDPLVGRDILFGVLLGLGVSLVGRMGAFMAVSFGGPPAAAPWTPAESLYLSNLMGTFPAVTGIVQTAWGALAYGLISFSVLVTLTVLFRNKWLAAAAQVALSFAMVDWLSVFVASLMGLIFALAMLRFGVLATLITHFVFGVTAQTFLTTDLSMWYGAGSRVALVVIGALALLGIRLSLDGPLCSPRSKVGTRIIASMIPAVFILR